jgi:hypothetical protein
MSLRHRSPSISRDVHDSYVYSISSSSSSSYDSLEPLSPQTPSRAKYFGDYSRLSSLSPASGLKSKFNESGSQSSSSSSSNLLSFIKFDGRHSKFLVPLISMLLISGLVSLITLAAHDLLVYCHPVSSPPLSYSSNTFELSSPLSFVHALPSSSPSLNFTDSPFTSALDSPYTPSFVFYPQFLCPSTSNYFSEFFSSISREINQDLLTRSQLYPLRFAHSIPIFFLTYLIFMIASRYIDCGSYILYESVWCCNTGLLLASLAIFSGRPLLLSACITGVCCDQTLWYFDLIYRLIRGKGRYLVGVARYLEWPETSWSKKYLCTHHLWFLPLCLYCLNFYLPPYSFWLSCVFTCASTGLCRLFTPKTFDDRYSGHVHYLNVNAAYEFWKDVKISILHICDNSHPIIYLLFMFVLANCCLNGPPYLLLKYIIGLFD